MNVSHSNNAHRMRRRRGSGDDQSLMERAQIKAPVEAITERGEITGGVFLEIEGMVTTGQTGLEIAEDGIADPLYSEWKDACTGSPIQPMSGTAEFMHAMAGEIELLAARIRLCKELQPMLDADLPPFAD